MTRYMRFTRWPSEVRIALLLGLSVVLPCLLLAVFGLRALRTEKADAEAALRHRMGETLRRDVVRELERMLDGDVADAARSLAGLDPDHPRAGTILRGLERPDGPFLAAFLLTDDGRVRDSELALVRARPDDRDLIVLRDEYVDLMRPDVGADELERFADAHPLGVDDEGYPRTLGFLFQRATILVEAGDPKSVAAMLDLEEALALHASFVSCRAEVEWYDVRAQRLREALSASDALENGRQRLGRKRTVLDLLDRSVRPGLEKRLTAGVGHDVEEGPEGDVALMRAPVPSGDDRPSRALLVLVLDRDAALRRRLGPELTSLELPPGFRAVRQSESSGPQGILLAEEMLASPLGDVAVAIVADGEDAVIGAAGSSGGRYMVILLLAILGAAAAAFVTLRTVSAEIRLAKRTGDFVSNITHELKTPLTAIRMFVETLQDDRVADDAERRECLDVIARETDRLQERIEKVLKLARLGAGEAAFDLRPGDPADVLHEAARTCRARMAGTPGAELIEEIPETLGVVRFDRRALGEAVANLLANSVKYSPRDRCHLRLTARREDGELVIEVGDRGLGIPPSEHERIFERFYRVDEPRVREVEGTGLGLALVRRIIEAHGGRISLESAPGEGSTFRIHLDAGE